MEKLSIGQVVLAYFPFSDLKRKKLRPCLIIGISEYDDILMCQITSQLYDGKRVIPLNSTSFKEGSIVVNSFIRPDKIATIDKKMIKKILGTLKLNKINEVKVGLRSVFELD